MSGYLKFSSNLFLEVAEQKRNDQFLDEWGYRRHILANTKTHGIVKDVILPETGQILTEDAFYVAKFGVSCIDKVVIKPGMIIDKQGKYVLNLTTVPVIIPSDSIWYWIKVKHKYSVEELGTVSIDALGNLSGVGTEFLNILRGQPNFPSKIRFLNSTLGNADDYEVVSVTDDNNAILQGNFVNETDLKFAVVGTFTPGYPIPVNDELIFQYDSFEYELVAETVLNTPPAHIANEEFMLSRVRSNGLTIIVEDKRTEWWRPWGEWWLDYVNRNFENKLIGVEGVHYDTPNSPRDKNIALLAWGFRFQSYTMDHSLKKVSILIGNGGTYKDTSFFNNGDFTGWRLYAKGGSWKTIIDSQKTGSQIVLTLDILNPDDYGSADELFIAPPFEAIEIRSRRDGLIIDVDDQDQDTDVTETFPWPSLERRAEYPINTQLAKLFLPVTDGCYKFNLTYRYRTFEGYTDWLVFPDDPIGFYDETSYDNYGNLKLPIDRTQIPYIGHESNGFIQVCEAPDSFQNFQDNVDTGDLIGVNTTSFDNATPVVNLIVGVSKQYQHYKGALTLTADLYIHLHRTDGVDYHREGNKFYLHIEQWINLNGFKIRIVEDYINPTSFTLLSEIDANDLMYIRNNTSSDSAQTFKRGLWIRCTFNELNHWITFRDTDITPKGTVRMVANNAITSAFDGLGVGQKQGFWGWQIMNGNNGTINMQDRFPMATTAQVLAGAVGGQNSYVLSASQMPQHSHTFSGTTSNDSHSHHLYYRDTGTLVSEPNGDPNFARGDRYLATSISTDIHSHTHTYSGTTSLAGGVASPSAIDNRPQFATILFIEKVV